MRGQVCVYVCMCVRMYMHSVYVGHVLLCVLHVLVFVFMCWLGWVNLSPTHSSAEPKHLSVVKLQSFKQLPVETRTLWKTL